MGLYDFNFDTAEAATTMGTVTQLLPNSSGAIVGMRLVSALHHAVWADNWTTVQAVTADGAFNVYGVPAAVYAGWPGATTRICGDACMQVYFLQAPNPVGQGSAFDTDVLAVGQMYACVRGYAIGAAQLQDSNVTVYGGLFFDCLCCCFGLFTCSNVGGWLGNSVHLP